MSVIERAEQRLNDEIRQHELGLDNVDDIQYWAAYLDGARAQKKDAADAIEALQAQLPKRGQWELIDGAEPMRWGCSRCKYLSWETSNYCPRCGAKMEVQE